MSRSAVAALVALMLVLAGCFRANVDLVIQSDGTVDGTMLFGYLPNGRDHYGLTVDEAVVRIRRQLLNDAAAGVACERYSEDQVAGMSCTLDGLSLEEMSQQDIFGHRLAIARQADRYELSGVVDLTEYNQDTAGFAATLRVTFPAPIVETNGDVDGRTVSWAFAPNTSTEVFASSAIPTMPNTAVGNAPRPWVIGVLAMALLAVALRLLRRHQFGRHSSRVTCGG